MREFRFRPRYRTLPLAATVVGGALVVAAPVFGLTGASLWFALGAGAVGLAMWPLHRLSPVWKLRVRVDEEALEVGDARGRTRFRLPWPEVKRVVASPETSTCFVDGGEPGRSLMVPGPGATAPYAIEERAALYTEILSHVPLDKVVRVELLERWEGDAERDGDGDGGRR